MFQLVAFVVDKFLDSVEVGIAINTAGTFTITVNCLISSLILTRIQQEVPHQKVDKDEKEGILLLRHGSDAREERATMQQGGSMQGRIDKTCRCL